MITSNPEQRSHASPDPRVKEAARRCAAKINASTEAHNEAITLTGFLRIARAYKTFQKEVAAIEEASRD